MPTKRSASAGSSPRPNWSAYSSASLAIVEPGARSTPRASRDSSCSVSVAEVAARDVDPERERQPGLEEPPLAEVDDLVQAVRPVGQLALVDEQPGLGAARRDLVDDLVERHLAVAELPPRQSRSTRNAVVIRPGTAISISRSSLRADRLARDDDRPVARAHARPVREEHVLVLDERVRVERDRGHLEPALERPLVQRLDVLQDVLELEPARVDARRRRGPRT